MQPIQSDINISENIDLSSGYGSVIQMISCNMSNAIFSQLACFEKHMDWHKNAQAIILDIVPNKEEPNTKKVFLEPREGIPRLKEHVKVTPEPRNGPKFKRTHCLMFCKYYPGLNRHLVIIHKKSTENPQQREQCPKTFKTVPDLKGHMFQHPHGRFAQPKLYNNPN